MNDRDTALSLCAAAGRFLGHALSPIAWLDGGDEALVMRAEGAGAAFAVHASSAGRSRAEVAWCHAVARHARRSVPEVVVPIARDGETVVAWRDRAVAIYPFVEGAALDRDDARMRHAAGALLARLHRGLLDWAGGPPPRVPRTTDVAALPEALQDAALDAWWAGAAGGAVTSVIHGDYYRRNLLCSSGAIAGIIDWHDATVAPLALELAGAIFELCKTDDHVLNVARAEAFLDAYRAGAGPVPEHEIAALLRFMRVWVRRDVASSLALGSDPGDPYVRLQIEAFTRLAGLDWKP